MSLVTLNHSWITRDNG